MWIYMYVYKYMFVCRTHTFMYRDRDMCLYVQKDIVINSPEIITFWETEVDRAGQETVTYLL